nr:hypothetical protein [Tanacetum cinerariifolium]
MWEVEPRERHRHMIIELDYPLLESSEAILFSKLTIDVCGSKHNETKVFQLCVKSFEIYGELKKEVFAHQPEGTLLSKERLVKKLTILCIRNLLGIGRFMARPKLSQWLAAKRIFKILNRDY